MINTTVSVNAALLRSIYINICWDVTVWNGAKPTNYIFVFAVIAEQLAVKTVWHKYS